MWSASTGPSRRAGLVLGSVAVTLSCHAFCPVVVVRDDDSAPDGPVVVGVNGAPENWYVLDRAFEEAEARGTRLVAVHVWQPPLCTARIAASVGIVWSELDTARSLRLATAQRLRRPASRGEGHHARRARLRRPPLGGAVRRGRSSRRGARGSGGLAGMVLGSTSQAVLRHAPCPVLLVRPSLSEQIARAQQT